MDIGIDSFSYHRFFGEIAPEEPQTAVRWTASDVLRHARELDVDAVSLQTIHLPSLEPDAMTALRKQFRELSLRPVLAWGHRPGLEHGANPAKVADLRRTLAAAKALGCSLVRFVAGSQHSFKVSADQRIASLIPILRDITDTAREHGVTLAIENHVDFAMADLVKLVEEVDAGNLGICFDMVNAVRVGDDLLAAVRLASPHIRMVHMRDHIPWPATGADPEGFWPSAPLGRGILDVDGLLGFLRASGYEGALFVEIAYMHPDYADELKVVAESVAFLKQRLSAIPILAR